MLLIEQFEREVCNQGSFVKCPICKTGRLFDRAKGVQVSTVSISDPKKEKLSVQMFIKCPKCSRRVGVSFTN